MHERAVNVDDHKAVGAVLCCTVLAVPRHDAMWDDDRGPRASDSAALFIGFFCFLGFRALSQALQSANPHH